MVTVYKEDFVIFKVFVFFEKLVMVGFIFRILFLTSKVGNYTFFLYNEGEGQVG